MDPLTIRVGKLSDHDAIRQCVDEAYTPYIHRLGKRPASIETDFTPLLRDGRVWVAETEERVVGLIVLNKDGPEPEIRSVAVLPVVQRHGIGRALVAHAEKAAREAGHSNVRLYTNANIPELVGYYTGLGYVEVERRLDGGYDRTFMRKRLDANTT